MIGVHDNNRIASEIDLHNVFINIVAMFKSVKPHVNNTKIIRR